MRFTASTFVRTTTALNCDKSISVSGIINSVSLDFESTYCQLFAIPPSHCKSARRIEKLRSVTANLLTFLSCYACCYWFGLEIGPKPSHTYARRKTEKWDAYHECHSARCLQFRSIYSMLHEVKNNFFSYRLCAGSALVSIFVCWLANAIVVSSCTFFSLSFFSLNFHTFAFFASFVLSSQHNDQKDSIAENAWWQLCGANEQGRH